MKYFIFILFSLHWAANGAEKCFSNQAEHEALKSRLPILLQKFPVLMTAVKGSSKAFTQLMFDEKNNTVRVIFNTTQFFVPSLENQTLVCIDEKLHVKLKLDNGSTVDLDVTSDKTINIEKMLDMTQVSESDYKAIEAAVGRPKPKAVKKNVDYQNGGRP